MLGSPCEDDAVVSQLIVMKLKVSSIFGWFILEKPVRILLRANPAVRPHNFLGVSKDIDSRES